MGRGGRSGCKPIIRHRNLHSDSSDEDYMVEEDELDNQSDELESLVGDASEEEFLSDLDLEDEEEEFVVRKVTKPRGRKASSGKRRNGVINQSRKRKRPTYDDEDDEDEDYDESDEEFTPDDLDSLDEEDDLPSARKKSGRKNRTPLKKRGSLKTRTKRGKKAAKRRKKKRNNSSRSRRKDKSADDGDFMEKSLTRKRKSKKKSSQRKKRVKAASDSDFTVSESSDYEFTMSEEELQQIVEAEELCRDLTEDLRSSKRIQEDTSLYQPKKLSGRKGKEKEESAKNDAGKQVCGICFTEERKNTVRGTLNCCSHFFCFACIMEWSKVESRCPMCKQRFITISKPSRCVTGVGPRNVVIQVPERDQVYQPSEEELAYYLMPDDGVLCTECLQGGDDALMLLCDNCDSPAHTYCVGLGHEVPEGNWYCEGCRFAALASSNGQAQDITSRQPTSTDVSGDPRRYENMAEIDLNVTIPETPVSEGNGFLSSPRFPGGNHQVPSFLGFGVSTLSGRRRIHRGIHNLLSGNRMSQISPRDDRGSTFDLSSEPLSSHIDRGVETNNQETRIPNVGTSTSTSYVDRAQDNAFQRVQSQNLFPGRLSQTNAEAVRFPAPFDGSTHVRSQLVGPDGPYLSSNQMLGYDQPQPCSSRSATSHDMGLPPLHNAQADYYSFVKQQVRPLVKNHLKSLARDIDLSYNAFKDIANGSTETLLAACGFEHKKDEVYEVRTPLCLHNVADGQMSPMRGCCTSCFDKFVEEVVRTVMDLREPKWFF